MDGLDEMELFYPWDLVLHEVDEVRGMWLDVACGEPYTDVLGTDGGLYWLEGRPQMCIEFQGDPATLDPYTMLERVVAKAEHMERFSHPGEVVVLEPMILWYDAGCRARWTQQHAGWYTLTPSRRSAPWEDDGVPWEGYTPLVDIPEGAAHPDGAPPDQVLKEQERWLRSRQ